MEAEIETIPLKKKIKNVTIVFEDGTRAVAEEYALVGFDGEIWYTVVNTPADYNDKVEMNNQMVKLSDGILRHLENKKKNKVNEL